LVAKDFGLKKVFRLEELSELHAKMFSLNEEIDQVKKGV
jgi:hypothetical protein